MLKQLSTDFLRLSENMTRTCVIPEFIASDLHFYNKQLMQVMQSICNKDIFSKFRVWIDGKESDFYFNKVKDTSPLSDENITQWSTRVFDQQKFGMIINNIESFAPALNKKVLHLLEPLINDIQIPSGGFDMALFIGNYGWTPIGIHKDLNGGKVIHLHLGPGEKTIYQWDDASYNKHHAIDPKTEHISDWIPDATPYHFKAGDIYFMNEEMWHIGKSEELSVGITFWFNHFDRTEIFKRLYIYLRDRLLENGKQKLPSFNEKNVSKELHELTFKTANPHTKGLENFFHALYQDYKFEMLSNGGFYTPSLKREAVTITLDERIQVVLPFKICYRNVAQGQLELFIRGHRVNLMDHPSLPAMIDQLNSGEPQQIREWAEPLLNSWADEIILYIVQLLYTHEGIELLTPLLKDDVETLASVAEEAEMENK